MYISGVENSLYISKEYLELFILYFNDNAFNLINKSELFKIPEHKHIFEYSTSLNVMINNAIIPQIEQDFLIVLMPNIIKLNNYKNDILYLIEKCNI